MHEGWLCACMRTCMGPRGMTPLQHTCNRMHACEKGWKRVGQGMCACMCTCVHAWRPRRATGAPTASLHCCSATAGHKGGCMQAWPAVTATCTAHASAQPSIWSKPGGGRTGRTVPAGTGTAWRSSRGPWSALAAAPRRGPPAGGWGGWGGWGVGMLSAPPFLPHTTTHPPAHGVLRPCLQAVDDGA